MYNCTFVHESNQGRPTIPTTQNVNSVQSGKAKTSTFVRACLQKVGLVRPSVRKSSEKRYVVVFYNGVKPWESTRKRSKKQLELVSLTFFYCWKPALYIYIVFYIYICSVFLLYMGVVYTFCLCHFYMFCVHNVSLILVTICVCVCVCVCV